MTTTPAPGTVRVCFERDMECGNNPRAWCSTCPKRPPGADLATDELLPCPFCGSTDELYHTGGLISCDNCGCEGPDRKPDYRAEWNRRANLAAVPASEPAKQWPFVESPGEFAARLATAIMAFGGDTLAAVRNVLIENPATLAAPAPVSGMPDLVGRVTIVRGLFGQEKLTQLTLLVELPQGTHDLFTLPAPQAPDTPNPSGETK